MWQDCLTFNLGDSYLTAADAFPSLTEGFDLDHIVLVDRQRQLQGGVVGLHHTGPTVFVLAVHHLQETQRERLCYGTKSLQTQCMIWLVFLPYAKTRKFKSELQPHEMEWAVSDTNKDETYGVDICTWLWWITSGAGAAEAKLVELHQPSLFCRSLGYGCICKLTKLCL